MGLFDKFSKKSDDAAGASELLDGAMDTLASVLRDFGAYAFDLDDDEGRGRLAERSEVWASHVLTGRPLQGELGDETGEGGAGERKWSEIRRLFRARRRAEERFVDGRDGEFKAAIWDLVHGLRSIAAGGRSANSKMQQTLVRLDDASSEESLESLRAVVATAVVALRQDLDEQRATFEGEMARMAGRLTAMREDLLNLRRQMEVDPLTKVYNRGAFDHAIERSVSLATLAAQPVGLLMIDLDHFKAINDRHGHTTGDLVLAAAADCVVRAFPRKSDFIARYGGEEFAVILFDTGQQDIERLGWALVERMRTVRVDAGGTEVEVRTSVGGASLHRDDTPLSLIERADAALYRAKGAGRDRFEFMASDRRSD
jgi:diguanylate cyclase (GGDEF)-like protein